MAEQNALTGKDYTTVNIDALSAIVDDLSQTLSTFSSAYYGNEAAGNENFTKLNDATVTVGVFPTNFDSEIEEMIQHVDSVIKSLSEYIAQIIAAEQGADDDFPEEPGTKDDDPPTNPGGTQTTLYDPSHADFFKNISLSDLTFVISMLNRYADEHQMTLDELLQNVECGEDIKKLLLEQIAKYDAASESDGLFLLNPDISDELKAYLEGTSGDFLLQDLQVVLFDPTMASQVFNYTPEVSSFFENFVTTTLTNIDGGTTTPVTLNDVLGNSDILKARLNRLNYYMTNTFSGIGESEIQKVLLNLYDTGQTTGGMEQIRTVIDGEDKDLFVNYVRKEIETMAGKNGVSCEEILTNEKYSKELMSIPDNLNKVMLYGETMSRTNNPSAMWPVGKQEVLYRPNEYYE